MLRCSAVIRRASSEARKATAFAMSSASAAHTGREMRDVMGHFATGVSVITARDGEGGPVGTTANAISSVSLEPPLLLACLAESSETLSHTLLGLLLDICCTILGRLVLRVGSGRSWCWSHGRSRSRFCLRR